jgi:hypothetical protein
MIDHPTSVNICPGISGGDMAVPGALGLHEAEPFPIYDNGVIISAERSMNDEQNTTMSATETGLL